MNKLEKQVKLFLEKNNWKILNRGWPDFLCTRQTHLGESVMAIEVKSSKDKLRPEQEIVHKILKKAGISIFVIRPEHLQKRKQLYGRLLWSSKNYKTYQHSIQRLDNELKYQLREINELKKQLDELSVVFDEVEETPLSEEEKTKKALEKVGEIFRTGGIFKPKKQVD